MRDGLDLARLTGLEIGPLASPLVGKAEGDILYVDHASREELVAKYAADPALDTDLIAPVDAVWGARTLAECLDGRRVDYVLASHVAEHVPDLVTWFDEIAAVLRPGGELRLVLPDKRYTFDYLREETRLADLLANHLVRARRPQLRDVLDFRLNYAPDVDAQALHAGSFDTAALRPIHSFDVVLEAATRVRDTDHYHDVHCWVVTPRRFACLMQGLAERGMLRMACARLVDTRMPVPEFYVFLQPCDDPARVADSWAQAGTGLCDPLPGSAAQRAAAAAAAELMQLRENTRTMQRQAIVIDQQALALARLAAAADAAARAAADEAARLHARVRDLEQSTSWRITAPLRRVRRLVEGRRR